MRHRRSQWQELLQLRLLCWRCACLAGAGAAAARGSRSLHGTLQRRQPERALQRQVRWSPGASAAPTAAPCPLEWRRLPGAPASWPACCAGSWPERLPEASQAAAPLVLLMRRLLTLMLTLLPLRLLPARQLHLGTLAAAGAAAMGPCWPRREHLTSLRARRRRLPAAPGAARPAPPRGGTPRPGSGTDCAHPPLLCSPQRPTAQRLQGGKCVFLGRGGGVRHRAEDTSSCGGVAHGEAGPALHAPPTQRWVAQLFHAL